MTKATLTLTASNMGDVTEADFDAWGNYVATHIDARTRMDVTVVQSAFQNGTAEDRVTCECPHHGCECEDIVKEALQDLWVSFCADSSAWPQGIAS